MGVHGLWKLIEASGRPVPPESLQDKILAVDVSIWLHHFIKGFQDNRGAAVPNAHLLGIYHRVCKLLFFRIKPIFVFDGGVPGLKKKTIAQRNQQKQTNLSAADRIHKTLLTALAKHGAISKVLSEKAQAAIESTSPRKSRPENKEDDLYVLPPSQLDSTVSSESEDEEASNSRHMDLHSIDTKSIEFKSLPVDVRHEILTDLKETRKQSSWGRIHELPTESNDFSSYQMNRLLKRQSVQVALEEAEKEMGGHSLSLGELEKLLKDEGVITTLKGSRIASDENTRYLLIKDIKQAILEAKKNNLPLIEENVSEEGSSMEEKDENVSESLLVKNKGEKEFEDDLEKAIALSLEEVPSTSKDPSTWFEKEKNKLLSSFIDDMDDEESEGEEEEIVTKLTAAQSYMMEYSGLTAHAINNIISRKKGGVAKKIEESAVSSSINLIQKNKIEEAKNEDQVSTSVEDEKNLNDSQKSEIVSSSVEVMSDSDSSCDDLIEVNGDMEVVIKPDEELEDDLFKDVFENEDAPKTTEESQISSSQQNKKGELKIVVISEDSSRTIEDNQNDISSSQDDVIEALDEVVEIVSNDQVKQQVQEIVKTYSNPQEGSGKISVEGLKEAEKNLRQEVKELEVAKFTKEKLGSSITDQMCQETQELLELFGIPYITAPMEAEAQCAFLDLADLTDGSITEDSDIWLFGGRTVYKNFFDQNKLVMEFKSESIQNHYKLSREQMILLAMLVGSDYTTGLSGVGPVTALEILAAFPAKNQLISGLADFKTWFNKGKLPGPGRTTLRGKLKNVVFNDNFPNPQIIEAYLEPTIDQNREKFTWAKPDIVGLIEFARHKFGWTKIKSEEILKPILKRMEDGNRVQKPITQYFKIEKKGDQGGSGLVMSKRVKSAVDRIGRGPDNEPEIKEKKISRKKKSDVGKGEEVKKKRVRKKKDVDEEVAILMETEKTSKTRVEEIERELKKHISGNEEKEASIVKRLHKKDVIPQKQKDKADVLKNKLKAIETFRKSKQGPGYVKKKGKVVRQPHDDASYLSDDSSD